MSVMAEDVKKVVLEGLPDWIVERPELGRRLREAIWRVPERERPPRMSYEEFLRWADEDTLAEWVDGVVVMSSPASKRHRLVGDFLLKVVGLFVETRGLGVVLSAPFQMKLESSGREPDLLFVSMDHLGRLQETCLDGPADLAVEIISPESAGRDRGEKFYEYARGGVPEYWLIDPEGQWAEFYHLEGVRYRLSFEGREGRYESAALAGFWLRVEWLWQEPLPHPLEAPAEIAGVKVGMVEAFLAAMQGLPGRERQA